MHERIQRHTAQETRGRITQTIRGPRVSGFVNGEGKQQDDEPNENLREIDVGQRPYRLRLPCEKRKDGIGEFRPDYRS